jgi:hypothetical protein
MFIIHAANAPQTIDRALVIEVTNQRIARIGRQGDNAARVNDLHSLPDQAQLRILRMNLKILAHKKSKTASAQS